ncbi:MAG: outer membrane beta-barrel protein [Bacteroidota bacterium]
MRLLIFTLLFSSAILSATTPDSLKTKKWAVGLSYSPDFCFRMRYAKASEKGSSNMTENGKMGFTTGINLRYQLLDKIGIEFGALYSTKGQKAETSSTNWVTPDNHTYDPSIPNYNSLGNLHIARKITFTYKYLEIPLKVNVYLINKRLKVFPSIGCSANIFMGKKTVSVYDGGKETSNSYDKKNIPAAEFAVLGGVGLSYDLTKNLFVKVEPSFRSFIRPLVDYPVSGTFYSLGANTGIYLKF